MYSPSTLFLNTCMDMDLPDVTLHKQEEHPVSPDKHILVTPWTTAGFLCNPES